MRHLGTGLWGVVLGILFSSQASSLKFEQEPMGPPSGDYQREKTAVWGYTVTDSGRFEYQVFPLMPEANVAALFRSRLGGKSRKKSKALAKHLLAVSQKYQFDPAFILAVIEKESSFRPSVVSYAGAVGLMQIMPATGRYVARKNGIRYRGKRDLYDPFTNIAIGVSYLSQLRIQFKDRFSRILAAYNVGPGRIGWLIAKRKFRVRQTKPYIEGIRELTIRFRREYTGSV